MQPSLKLTAALLTTLFVGGSFAGSLFSSVLNEESSSSLGTAGAFFSALNLPDTSVSVSPALLPKTEKTVVVVAEALPTPVRAATDPVTEIRALTQNLDLFVLSEASPTPDMGTAPEPSIAPEPESTVAPEPEMIVASVPEPENELTFTSVSTPEQTEPFIVEELSSIEP